MQFKLCLSYFKNSTGKLQVSSFHFFQKTATLKLQTTRSKTKMLKTELIIETIGQTNIQVLSDSEQHTFLETLFANILKLANNQAQGVISNE